MNGEQQIVRSSSQEEPDYADSLEPRYRFSPTDLELIVHYLKKKIETGNHPKCRLHEVNLYDYSPQELSERYLSHENNWYFLTSRERKYLKGNLPSRKTKNFGFWRATQRYTTVYNSAREAVGRKRCLAYYDDKEEKTSWLMHEYTTNDPNLPVGSDDNKLNDCVLCKVYKMDRILTEDNNNNNQSGQVRKNLNQEQNQLDDEPRAKRRRESAGNQPNGPEHIQKNSTTDVEIATPGRFMSISYTQPVNNMDGCGHEPFPPQTLQQPVNNIPRINPNLRTSSAVKTFAQQFAREQVVGPYSDNYGGGNTMGTDPYTPTSYQDYLDDPTDPVTWATHIVLPPRTNVEIATPVRFMSMSYQPFPPQTLLQPVDNIMHTRINPNLRRPSSAVEAFSQQFAREQVGPYSHNDGGGNTLGTDAHTPSTDYLDDPTDPVTWAINNINFENLPPCFLADFPHEDPNGTNEDLTSETWPYFRP